jgi:hypothetical protein
MRRANCPENNVNGATTLNAAARDRNRLRRAPRAEQAFLDQVCPQYSGAIPLVAHGATGGERKCNKSDIKQGNVCARRGRTIVAAKKHS